MGLTQPLRAHRILVSSAFVFLATFFVCLAFAQVVEEYDGYNRRLVTDSIWLGEPLAKTWFELGASLTLLVAYPLANMLLPLASPTAYTLPSLAIALHSCFFVAFVSAAMFALVRLLNRSLTGVHVFYLALTAIALNPLLFSAERFLIETPVAAYLLTLVLGAYLMEQKGPRWGLCVLMGGATFLVAITRMPFLLLPAGLFCLALYRRWWSLAVALACGVMAGLPVALAWNRYRYGSAFTFGYGKQGFDASLLDSLWAYLLSPGQGVLFFAPVAMLGIWVLGCKARQSGVKAFWLTLCLAMGACFLVMAKWWAFHGGLTYGPRLVLPLLPLLCVFGIGWMSQRATGRLMSVVLTLAVFWGLYVNFNSILLPVNHHWQRWQIEDQRWQMPAREKQLHLSVAERLEVFDPLFSPYLGKLGYLLARTDLWELPFVTFSRRRVNVALDAFLDREVEVLQLFTRSPMVRPWKLAGLRVLDRTANTPVAFELVGNSRWQDKQHLLDKNRATFATLEKPGAGDGWTIRFAAPIRGRIRISMIHENQGVEIPHSYVLQSFPGSYFGGWMNDSTYIPFTKSYSAKSYWSSLVAFPAICLLLGLLMLGALLWWEVRSLLA